MKQKIKKYYYIRPQSIREKILAGLQTNQTKKLNVDVEGKGLGVITLEKIKKDEFIVEYKFSHSYSREERESHEEEYRINNEGCYILEAKLPTGKWLCLDATKNFQSFGR